MCARAHALAVRVVCVCRSRYLGEAPPSVSWVPEATLAIENAQSIEGGWAHKQAMAYRGWGGQLPLTKLTALLCEVQRGRSAAGGGNSSSSHNGSTLFALLGSHVFRGLMSDAVIDADIGNGGGGGGCRPR